MRIHTNQASYLIYFSNAFAIRFPTVDNTTVRKNRMDVNCTIADRRRGSSQPAGAVLYL